MRLPFHGSLICCLNGPYCQRNGGTTLYIEF